MELFSLLAKLTLDASQFNSALDQAQSAADDFEAPETPELGLDTQEFNSNIDEAGVHGTGFETTMTGVFQGIKNALTVTGIVAAVAGIVNGIKQAVDLTAQTADGIDKGAQRLSISRKAYQEWDHALKQSGGSIGDVNRGIRNMQLLLKAADPSTMITEAGDAMDGLADKSVGMSDELKSAFNQLGLLDRVANGELKTTEDLMEATLLALAGFEGTEEERGIITRKLFGNNADGLNALLNSGVEGVQELLNEADDLGLVMSDDEIANAVAYGDAVANLQAELQALQTAFVADIIPVLTDAVGWLTDFLSKLNPRLQTSSIYSVFAEINTKTLLASTQIDEATQEAASLISKLQEMGDYWTLDEEGRMTWDALAEKALELFPQLSDYIDTDGKKIRGNTDEIMANVKAWALLEKQRILSAAMEEKQKAIAEQLTKAYEKGAEARAKEAEADGKRVTAIKNLNDLLKEQGMATLDLNASQEEVSRAQQALIESLPEDDPLQLKAGLVFKEYGEAWTEAAKLRDEADKMKEEANAAKDSLADEQKYLMEEMGYTQEEIDAITKDLDAYIKKLTQVPSDVYTTFHTEYDDRGYDHSYAIGSAYIPYDQLAMVHRGERIMTATEARQDTGADLTGLEDRITAAIRAGMENATVRSYLNGRDITDEVNRNNMQQVKARRYSP